MAIADVALSALRDMKAATCSMPHIFSQEITNPLRLPGFAENLHSSGLTPKDCGCECPPGNFDDDISDDGLSEFRDPSYKSCILRDTRPLVEESMRATGAESTSTSEPFQSNTLIFLSRSLAQWSCPYKTGPA